MKPQLQTILYPEGNCQAACVASILEIPIDDVPNYHGDGWWDKWQEWAYNNYRCRFIYWENELPNVKDFAWWIGEVIPYKTSHAVVFYKDEFRWDPYPGGPRRGFSINDVKSVVTIYSIGSIFED